MIKYLETSTIDFLPLNNKEAHNCLRTYRHQKTLYLAFRKSTILLAGVTIVLQNTLKTKVIYLG